VTPLALRRCLYSRKRKLALDSWLEIEYKYTSLRYYRVPFGKVHSPQCMWVNFSTEALVYVIVTVACPVQPGAGHMICGKTCIRYLTLKFEYKYISLYDYAAPGPCRYIQLTLGEGKCFSLLYFCCLLCRSEDGAGLRRKNKFKQKWWKTLHSIHSILDLKLYTNTLFYTILIICPLSHASIWILYSSKWYCQFPWR